MAYNGWFPCFSPNGEHVLTGTGDLWFNGAQQRAPDWAAVLAVPGTHLHLYGKLDARPGRKMGHLNVTGPDLATTQARARQAADLLGIAPWQ